MYTYGTVFMLVSFWTQVRPSIQEKRLKWWILMTVTRDGVTCIHIQIPLTGYIGLITWFCSGYCKLGVVVRVCCSFSLQELPCSAVAAEYPFSNSNLLSYETYIANQRNLDVLSLLCDKRLHSLSCKQKWTKFLIMILICRYTHRI